jgi:hypothetical protein
MVSEAPELMAIKDANLRMQRELFLLAAERDRAVDRYQLAEDKIDDLEALIKAYRDAWARLGEYQELPPLTDDELMDDTTREHRNAARDAAYDAVARCRDDLLKAVAD